MVKQDLFVAGQPHHDGSALYVHPQDPRLGDTVTVRLWVPNGSAVHAAQVRTVHDGEMELHPMKVQAEMPAGTWWSAELVLNNPVLSYRFVLESAPDSFKTLNGQGLWCRSVPDDSDFRITAHPNPPAWLAEAIVYQIFPDRFASTGKHVDPAPDWAIREPWEASVIDERGTAGRQFYGGDLDGIAERIDHISGLGANVIYLTPIFPAYSSHRYDAASFDVIDPHLGGEPALGRLLEAAHGRGVRVIGDLTTNHTGSHHDWFAAAQSDAGASERDYYYWNDDGTYIGWLGHASLPKLNYSSPDVRRQLFEEDSGPLRKWLAVGLDGWRIDVANMTGRSKNDDFTHEVARAVRAGATSEREDAYVVAEHFFDYTRDLQGDGWHGVMNYQGFTFPVWGWLRGPGVPIRWAGAAPLVTGSLMVDTIEDFCSRIPWANRVASLNILESHDTARILTLVGGDLGKLEAAVALLMTMPGVPMVEYGGEVGMEGLTGEDGRRTMPWPGEDGSEPNTQTAWDQDIYQIYQKLATLRRTLPALQHGGLRWLITADDAVVFLREAEEQTALVHVSRAAHASLELDVGEFPGLAGATLVHGEAPDLKGDKMLLQAKGAGATVLIWEPDRTNAEGAPGAH